MNWNSFPWRSLKTKITLATLAIFLAGIWSLSFYATRMLRVDMQRQSGEQQFSTVSMLAAQIDNELKIRLEALEMNAKVAAEVMQKDPAAIQAFIDHRAAMKILFNGGFSIHDVNGTTIATFPVIEGRLGNNFMHIDAIAAALKEGKPAIGLPYVSKTLQTPLFLMAVPIRDDAGKTIGAFGGVTVLSQPNFLDQITRNHYGKTGDYLLVAPQHRLIVNATDKRRIMETLPATGKSPTVDRFLVGHEGSTITDGLNGEELLVSYKAIPTSGWNAVVTLPGAEAFAPIRDMQRRMLAATLLLSLLAGGLTWLLLKRQLWPLVDTARTLASLSASGQRPSPLPIVRQDEIGQLVAGFNGLLATLGQREALLTQLLDTSRLSILLLDMEGRIIQANQRTVEMFGRPVDELLGSPYASLIPPADQEAERQKELTLPTKDIPSTKIDRLFCRADQTQFWGYMTGRRFLDPVTGDLHHIIEIADITERKRAEEKLQLAAIVFSHAREGIMITSADATIIDVNEAFTGITGYSREEALGRNPRLFKSGRHGSEFYAAMWQDLDRNGHWLGEMWNRHKNGEIYVELNAISVVRDAQGQVQHYVALFSDITRLKEHENQLEHIAHYDVLTALPNRVLLADRLHQAMAQAQRHKQLLSVVYLDLDEFKAVNDAYGRKTGDELLTIVADRMKLVLREGDTLARLGGDEFVAVLFDLDDVAASVPILSRLLAATAQPVSVRDLVLQVSASLGVTFYPQTEEVDADQLLRQADQAMYQAKVTGKNRYHVFDAEQDRSVRGHHESLQRIRLALDQHEFVLYYQPKVNMRTGTVIGAEALIRWQHPDKGLLPPAAFLPDIEDHTLAIGIGEWVIDEALCQIERWRLSGLSIPVSVNVGACQLQHPDFISRLREMLEAHPAIRAGDLEMEVLETSALEDLLRISEIIKQGKALGVKFSVDDFGTGYSSLTYLKRLPVSMLKIDQSFVRDMLDDPDDLAILEGVISLASAFRREVIAEGVETIEHGKLLLQLGCELAQGYGIARPMPANDLPQWASTWRPDSVWQNVLPIDRDDLPVLFACFEHRAWVVAVERYLKNEQLTLPPQDVHECRFGQWLDTDGKNRHGATPVFADIEQLHRQVHQLAGVLCEHRNLYGSSSTIGRLPELHDLRDTLLMQMKILM
jgi:diguanylate cyclase (GGDEF)-like protein/PAS domain S-box-containing protein